MRRIFDARRLFLLASCAALGFAAPAPAGAQFFFPFFDNRPTRPPSALPRQPAAPSIRRRLHADSDERSRLLHKPGASAHHGKTPPVEDRRHGKAEKPGSPDKSARLSPGGEAGAPAAAPPVVEGPPPPYEPQLLRLSEIMGALAYLQTVCADVPASGKPASEDAPWRDRMQTLITAEAAGPTRRDRLAGAYNHGFQGYEVTYRTCTPNARLVQQRYLDEGGRLAHEISTQYRAN